MSEKLVDRLQELRSLAKHWAWGDVTDYTIHGEDCPAGDEDAFAYQLHAKDCDDLPGQRIDLVTKPGTSWPVWPDIECCDPSYERDEDAIADACDCSVAAWDKVLELTEAALTEAPRAHCRCPPHRASACGGELAKRDRHAGPDGHG